MLQKATVLRKLERIMMAITFAEANLRDVAVSFLKGEKKSAAEEKQKRVEKQKKREEIRL